jgi:hypothetical protein
MYHSAISCENMTLIRSVPSVGLRNNVEITELYCQVFTNSKPFIWLIVLACYAEFILYDELSLTMSPLNKFVL